MKTYTIKPGDTIVAKVEGTNRTCTVSTVGKNTLLVIPNRTKRTASYEPPCIIQPSDIISINPTSKI